MNDDLDITDEWAKQVARKAFGELPFDTMRVYQTAEPVVLSIVVQYGNFEIEAIPIQLYRWLELSQDYWIGYGPKSNTLVIRAKPFRKVTV